MDANRERMAIVKLRKNCFNVYAGVLAVEGLEEFYNQFVDLGALELATKTDLVYDPDRTEDMLPVTGVEAIEAFQAIMAVGQLSQSFLSQITPEMRTAIRKLNLRAEPING